MEIKDKVVTVDSLGVLLNHIDDTISDTKTQIETQFQAKLDNKSDNSHVHDYLSLDGGVLNGDITFIKNHCGIYSTDYSRDLSVVIEKQTITGSSGKNITSYVTVNGGIIVPYLDWRVTFNDVEYQCTSAINGMADTYIGNLSLYDSSLDATDFPFCIYCLMFSTPQWFIYFSEDTTEFTLKVENLSQDVHHQIKEVLIGQTEEGNTSLGYGNYYAQSGSTNIYGDSITMTSRTSGLDKREYGVNKILWEGSIHMNSDQIIALSDTVSHQPNGIVLVWSEYDNMEDVVENQGFITHFIPKILIELQPNKFHTFNFTLWYNQSKHFIKGLYIGDRIVAGHSVNTNQSDPEAPVNYCILRYIIGV